MYKIASGNVMYDAGSPKSVLCDNLEGWSGEGARRGDQEGGDTCITMANSCCCMAKNHHNIVK